MILRLLRIPRRLFNFVRAAWMTLRYVDEWTQFPAFAFRHKGRIKIIKHPTARLVIKGVLIANPWPNAEAPCLIELLADSQMTVTGPWSMKDDARIKLFAGARLSIEGVRDRRQNSSMLGTRSQILVAKEIEIGPNCGISWDVTISDSNWHSIDGQIKVAPVRLGEHVWVAPHCTIMPGTILRDDCVVATHAVVLAGDYPERALLCGVPARITRIMNEPWVL